jgi:hypothetical protein
MEQFSCFNPPMTGDDVPIVVDDHRVDEAEPLQCVRDLAELLFRVLVRVATGRSELTQLACSRGRLLRRCHNMIAYANRDDLPQGR